MQNGTTGNPQVNSARRLIEYASAAVATHHVREDIADIRFRQQDETFVGQLQRPPTGVNASTVGDSQNQLGPARNGIDDFPGHRWCTLS